MTESAESMRVSVLRAVEDVAVERRPIPEPGPHEVLVRVSAVGTCGSDTHYYERGRVGEFVVREPLVLGHEASGTIVARGSEVTGLESGTRVSLEPGVPCLSCHECRSGRYNLCPEVRFFATPPVDGAFSEYVTLHEQFAYPVPEELSDEAAALIEPLSVAVWACRKARIAPGARVLVTGAGPVGLLAAQTARAFGATEIVVTDVVDHRLRMAEELTGCTAVNVRHHPLAESGHEPDVLLECSGNPTAAAEAVRTVVRAGRVVFVGMGGDELPLPLSHVQTREIEVTGTFRYANTWPTAIALASSGAVELDRLVTHRFGLDAVPEALTASARDETVVKAVVHPQE
ncbi:MULTISPECIES: NAD(P)-dependent alcohol dehydrogenase [unclassified Actinopolyspora]|uniref:NAD(P)-dependent alcohol dehydrogenase n=1 Tax=unclassified Actinopolyspora TaxID=2639451 RepID=UPI0013F6454A|nr:MULTISPECIES: NAD(P)-dependent alcohol dehydrogenase [unclassified Actinopolyspora]NHD17546.1 NAD(P)-dependent alcohol dehydrogenase [Actinopolyspora sp. BKK2]NHE76721.1 NAD(P)-dependent alcohol dehydrogenase [Actinopolyspora sp. BKK1]